MGTYRAAVQTLAVCHKVVARLLTDGAYTVFPFTVVAGITTYRAVTTIE